MNSTLITGGTGIVGSQLVKQLENPVVISRSASRANKHFGSENVRCVEWKSCYDQFQPPDDIQVDQVVNLMGASVADGRWTNSRKKELVDSRVTATNNLIAGLKAQGQLPKTFILSLIHISEPTRPY